MRRKDGNFDASGSRATAPLRVMYPALSLSALTHFLTLDPRFFNHTTQSVNMLKQQLGSLPMDIKLELILSPNPLYSSISCAYKSCSVLIH